MLLALAPSAGRADEPVGDAPPSVTSAPKGSRVRPEEGALVKTATTASSEGTAVASVFFELGLGFRELGYEGRGSLALLEMRSGAAVLPGLGFMVRPFHALSVPVLPTLEVRAFHRWAVDFDARTADGASASVEHTESQIDASVSIPVGRVERLLLSLGPRAGYHHMRLRLRGDTTNAGLPAVDYGSLLVGAEVRATLDRVQLTAGGGYLAVLDAGSEPPRDLLPPPEVSGFLADARLDYRFGAWRVGVQASFVGYELVAVPTEGTDRYLRLATRVAAHF